MPLHMPNTGNNTQTQTVELPPAELHKNNITIYPHTLRTHITSDVKKKRRGANRYAGARTQPTKHKHTHLTPSDSKTQVTHPGKTRQPQHRDLRKQHYISTLQRMCVKKREGAKLRLFFQHAPLQSNITKQHYNRRKEKKGRGYGSLRFATRTFISHFTKHHYISTLHQM